MRQTEDRRVTGMQYRRRPRFVAAARILQMISYQAMTY